MLFETDLKKPLNGNTLRNGIKKPVSSTRPSTYSNNVYKAVYKPVQKNVLAYVKPAVKNITTSQMKRPAYIKTYVPPQKSYQRIASTQIKKPLSPLYRTIVNKPVVFTKPTITQSRSIFKYPAYRPIQRTGLRNYNYGRVMTPSRYVSPQAIATRNIYRGPVVLRRGINIPGRRTIYPGALQTSAAVNTTPIINTGINTNVSGRYVPGYGYCVPGQPIITPQQTAPLVPSISAPSPSVSNPAPTCHTCGKKSGGCTTLLRFVFNSAHLTAMHQKQIRDLAIRILKQHSNAVIITGHTDKSGKENYNQILGFRRAGTVMRALKKQLALLKPNSHKDLFFKIRSGGEKQPISNTDAAINRRVHICLRKLKAA